MDAPFSPAQIFSQLLRVDPRTARLLLAGLAVLACAAIVASWRLDTTTAGLIGLYIAGLGGVVTLVSNVLTDELLKRILGIASVSLLILIAFAFAISAVWRNQPYINPTYCLVRFWERCELIEERIVAENRQSLESPAKIPDKAAVPASAAFKPGDFTVWVQFAGLIARDDVRALGKSLLAAGWRVPGPDGERTSNSAGLNEVRYQASASEPAAQALADAISATKITSKPVRTRQSSIIKPGTLEIWISN